MFDHIFISQTFYLIILLAFLTTTGKLLYTLFVELFDEMIILVYELDGLNFTFALFVRAHFTLIFSFFKAYFAKEIAANVRIVSTFHRLIDRILAYRAIVVILVQLDSLENFVNCFWSSQSLFLRVLF